MSITVFLTCCILGIDFMMYVLFQWLYGDKRRAMARKLAAIRSEMKAETAGPRLVRSREGAVKSGIKGFLPSRANAG